MEQDELAEVREKIREIIHQNHRNGFVYLGESADQILSLALRRGGGVCPRCNGVKYPPSERTAFSTGYLPCPKCKGTGKLPVEEKSIKDILGGWKGGTNYYTR